MLAPYQCPEGTFAASALLETILETPDVCPQPCAADT